MDYLPEWNSSPRTDNEINVKGSQVVVKVEDGGDTMLLNAGVVIIKVKQLLGHRHVTTTQTYDKRRRSAKDEALHDVLI